MSSVATLTELTPAQRRELLKMARARDLVEDRPELPPIRPAAREGRLPLSFAQERLWFIDRLEPGSAVYNLSVAWRLGGALDEAALERALGEIVRRHEALRTTFAEVDGSPVQVIAPFRGFALPVEDLSGSSDEAVRRRAGEEARRPFDLSAGPPFRASLLRLGAGDHVLLVSMHHIVSDGWSMGVLYRELSSLYEAYREGGESPLSELPVQYADYAVWQREQLEGEVLDRQLSYWRERLAGAPELLELPTDRPRPPVQTYRGATVSLDLSLELLERLQALGRSEGATLYMTLLGAFQVLLAKYSGSEDVVVGSPIAGRTRKEIEETIGFFVNTVVLRTDLSGDPGFREVLRRAREVTLGAHKHQSVPLERLVAELQPERSMSHTPLFQVMFALQNAVERGVALPGLEASEVGAEAAIAKFDLSLMPKATAEGLRLALNYSTDLFERGTAERMLSHLARVLEQVAADVDVRLSDIELLAAEEREQVLQAWNRTERGYADPPAHELFAGWARRAPEAVALLDGRATVTYGELERRASILARQLRDLGVGPETPVGLCMERTPELLVGVLGIWKAGGAYVPLDPGYPAERLAWIITDAALSVVVATGSTAAALPEHGASVVRLDQLPETAADAAPELPASDASLAYVIYTSGSTGRPKGVLVEHRSLANLLAATREAFGVVAGDVMPALASYAFDIWLFEALLPLTSGAAVRLVARDRVLDVPALLEEIADATLVHAVPALMRQLVHAERDTPRLRRLRRAFVGGDRVAADLLAEMRETLSGAETHVLYGPTEGTILASVYAVPADGAVEGHPIGAPLGNVRLYVCDALGNAQPAGVPGELLIGGAGVARGYLGRAGLTAERFVPDPFGAEPGARLYRTGDRVRWMADGTLEFLGRLDGQVKIRGFRIEPGEIEAVLSAHDAVREARVIVREDAPGEHRLVAYVVGGAEADGLRRYVRESLPEYMVPSAFVVLERLPLTPNGKLDRKALPAPELASAEERYEAPGTPVEEVLAGIWAEVLGLERVGRGDSFFELGGHSLLVTRVVSRVRDVFAIELPLRALFEGPTVAELALRVEEMRRAELPVLPPVVPAGRTGALPLSFAQERLWFIDRLDPGSTAYNMPVAWRLGGALDEAALERALGEIVRRHEALRTVFAEVDGSPVQMVAPFGGFALQVEDLSGLSEMDREAAVRRRAGEEALRSFYLAAGPLFRAALLRLGAEDHVLLLSMHHIVSDGWSMGVLFRELSVLYEAYREGRESPLAELPVQYADYAVWQREQLAGEVLDRQLSYWRERLAGAPELLELPTDHPRPAAQSFRGAHERIELSLELLERLQALGRSEGATLYMVLLGAFQVLLSRYSGSEDVVVGSPIAGRTRKEVEELIGFFVNTLVLRADLSGDPGFREVLRRVREVTLGAYEHQEVPFEKLVAELQPERSLRHAPLFQVMFSLQDRDQSVDGLAGLESRPMQAELAIAKFDLMLGFTAHPQGLRGTLTYSTDLFERGTVDRMLGHLQRVLEQVAADADVRLSQLDLLAAEEREQVLTTWNQTERGYSTLPVHALFAEWARRAPEAVALLDGHEAVTYAALDRRASILARHLRDLGVGPETPVGLCMERTPELLVGVLGIWKAGGAYVPLDPGYPAERLGWIISDAALPVVVATGGTVLALPEHGATLVRLDQLSDTEPDTAADAATEVAASDASLAYVIYTSGSTGRPKGVLVQHGALANLLAATREAFGVDEGDVMPALASYAFDIWLFEALLPLTSGAAVRLVERERVLDVPALLAEIADATFVHAVPALMRQVVQAERETPRLGRLRRAFVGGDRVPADLLAEMREVLPGAETHVLYGPTEGTILASTHPVPADGIVYGHPIGRPLGNVRLYVCDALGRPQPAGVPGELLIGGAGVARGYLGRAGLTAERFVPDACGEQPGATLYRTGDRVRRRADGTLEFLGRLDEQVKIRGFRIEPGEVEAVLSAHEAVREARVIVREDAPGEHRLVAYVVGSVEAEGLRRHMRDSLPEYMVPSAFVVLDQLPLTPNGKLDRKALPAPEYAADTDRHVAPRTPVEEVLAGIWAGVLGLEQVGVTESFFELGGHSLLATRVVSRIRDVFAIELPLRALFEGPTVAELAGRVEEMRRAELPVLPPVVPAERTGALPLSFAQERLWFIDRLDPGSTVYNIPMAWRLGGALDESALERALGEIVRRHEALRTTFTEVDGSPVQVIAPFAGFTLPVDDLSGLPEADREAAVRRRAGDEARRPFDLSAGPLFRASLLRLGAEDHVLLLSMHHVVSDGWSVGVFFRELSALYAAYREGGESPLAELPVQYADYAAWQREQLAGEMLDRQLSYWRDRLAGAPELLELPTDHPRPAAQSFRGAHERIELPGELLERLQALGRSEGATLYMVLLGAFQLLLSKYSGGEDVVVGSPIAGRTRGEVEGLIGFFVNTLVLRTDLSGDPAFREVLRRVREVTLGAYEHQEVPFEKLVAEVQPERSLSHSPLFQVMFSLQDRDQSVDGLAGLESRAMEAELATTKFDLMLGFTAHPQGLRGTLMYSTDLFERGTIRRMLGHLGLVLEQVAADVDARFSDIELLAAEEREQVLTTWNQTDRGYSTLPVHALFAEWARRAPEATALLDGRSAVTYGELDRRASLLARHLRDLGVGPETAVGLCMERTPELLVGVLGIWKAGGAYVPLDPGYPSERLGWIITDAALPVVVATGGTAAALPEHGATLVRVDQLPETEPDAATEVPASDARLAYVIYTSGSTGRPKGVLVQHGSLANLLAATREAFGVVAGDVMPALASYAFDIWLFEALLPLTSGAAVRLVDRERVLDVPALVEEISDATFLHAVPALMRQVVHAERETPRLRRLRSAFVGGDRVPADLLAEMREVLPEAETHVLYGPTEGTILASTHPVPEDGIVEGHPIGRPLGNVRLYVCDAFGSAQPAGVPGELLIGGAGVARGYLGRSAMTAERFVPDPFSAAGGARLYRTGDRARWTADGTLEFLGRVDTQVKVRGFRIEPGEIEAVLRGHESVTDCVVVAREDVPGETRLVAYVVGGVEAEGLREHLRKSVPDYMVPAAFMVLEALPLTPNGKLDRKALPAPELASAEERYVAPRTPVEEVLAGIWAEVLRLERVGVEESFFALGGHSLLATRVVSRIRDVFAIELPLRALFEGPTVAELAGRVEEMRRAELPVLPPVMPVERTGALPLSFAQERLWFIDRLEPGSTTYNMPLAWRLGGGLDEAALERSLSEIVRRHEALRTVFAEVGGSPVQVIAPFDGFALQVEDLSGLGEADREAAVRRRAGEEAQRAFYLAAGPLFRASLLRLGEEDHVLLLSMHHIVSDGWSMGVLFRELSVLYEAYREGRESPLAELPVQYADYAAWQRGQLEGEVLDRQLSYWRERLAGAPELLELPTDHPRPAVQSFRGAHERIELSLELLERLQTLGRSEGATLYMVLLGAFQVLLSRYSGSEDIVVGSPIAGRTRKEVEELIGFFLNTLVLRTDLSGDPSFREVLRRVREVTLGAYEHQEVPFEKLVAEVSPERSLSHSPLFQVMFALQNAEGGGALPGLSVSGVDAELTSAKFDLSLVLTATAQGLRGGLTYSTDLFERSTVDRMLGHLERVLEQVAADADVGLSQLDLLGDEEREQVLATWNQTERGYADPPVHELFADWARRVPEAVALLDGREAVTYGALDRRASILARHLRDLGVGPETPVGLCMERTPELLVGVLGIWKAGGAYVPLDPGYPAERLGWIISDAALPVVVVTGGTATALPEHGATLVRLDQRSDAVADASTEVPASAAGLAYVIYTSGSTGRPKGVQVQHGSLANLLAATREAFGVIEGDVMPALASYAFDIWLFEALLPLTSGAAVRLVDRDKVLDVPGLLEEISDATLVHAVPALMRQVVQAERETPRLRRLRRAFVGGDRVPADLLAEMREVISGAETHVLYGPTEGTILASTHPVPADGIVEGHPIGRPLGNVRLYVCDAFGRPQPAGVPGELLIGGAGVARGYLGRAGLTAERFVPDPFGGEPGARLYRTGDRVRRRADGTLEFQGRTDFQVKIRGFRIEPGEVEAVLRQHQGVAECAVVAREDAPGDTRLVAYVVGGVEAEELREHLRKSVPEYMVPSAFVVLEQLPLTPNGKLDRKALPAPEYAADTDRHVAPRTPVEEVLAGIWAEVLRLERVGVHDSFFALGGHSLLATRVVSRIRDVFAIELPLRALFEGPTVAEMAGRVDEMRRAELPVLPPVVPVERTKALPLSFAQERLWFIDRMDPGSTTYNMPGGWRLGGALDERALERALGEIVRRHEALRTTFAEVGGSPVQVIAPVGGFALPVEDLSGLSGADREAAVRRRAGEEARRAFDLSAGPLFRATLLRLGEEEHVLLLSMHHIVSDGWSMGVFSRELSALYAAYREGRESPLPELAVQYADYAAWQREQLAGEVLDRQLAYWKERLAGAPELLELPTDHPRPAAQSFRGAHEQIELSLELLERLQALGRSEGTTLYMTLLGAFQVLLSKYSGSEDIVVGSPIAGRTRGEVEELIGFFVNTLVLRTDLSGDPSFREVLRRAREGTLGAYEHQEVPFEKLVAELQPERTLSHSPLFQVMFALQNAEGGGSALPGLSVSGVGAELTSAKFDLSLVLTATAQGLRGGLTYSTDLFERSTVDRMLGHLEQVLEQVALDPDVRLSQLDLLGEAEREQVLQGWNQTERGYADPPAHALFAEWARRAPEAVALLDGREAVSYGELDRRASILARHLRDLGVGPETPVGLCLERTPELLVGVLGIWKAGGAYVPLDPSYPSERLGWIITDAALPVVVSTGSTAAVLPEHGATLVLVDQLPETAAEMAMEVPASAAGLAYVIYTSGSTGRPKGVLVPHGSLSNLLAATREAFGVVAGDVMPALASYAFDIWLFEALLPLTSGAAVRLVDRERVLDVPALLEEISDATLVHAVPALMRQVVQAERETRRLGRLRRAFVGGDRVPADLLAEMRATFSGAETHVLYGPTEGTVLASTHPVPAEGRVEGHPIGRPLGNVRLYVCDAFGNAQPAGVPGELLIGGAGVARGYLGRADLTAERFVPDAFGAEPGARLYRTGDRARWRMDGTLEFLGRVDAQVKIRGFRIEPGEIEGVLRQHENVTECVVVARDSAPGETRLVAYVVGGVEAEELREHLRKSVPDYMVPAAFVVLEALPLTPNGKLDRKALPAPDLASAEERYVAPRTPVEEVLAGIWAEVLSLERVGVHDSFFALGGHSLLIMRLLAEIKATFDLELSIRTVFSMPTVDAMAAEIERMIYEDVSTMSEFEAEQLAESHPVAGV